MARHLPTAAFAELTNITVSPSSLLLPSPVSKLGPHPHGSDDLRVKVHIAHGVIASIAIVILFPSVAIILRIVQSQYIVRLHYTMQLVNICVLLVAFSLGVWLSWLDGWLWHWPHQIIGTIVVALFLIQPVLGFVQHRKFVRTGIRSIYSNAHVWYGRFLIVLGIINGGLGLQLAANASAGQKAAYIVVTLVMLVTYVGAQVWYHWKVRKGMAERPRLTKRMINEGAGKEADQIV